MTKKHPVLNVFEILFSIVFSIVLVAVLVVTPFVSTVAGFTQPETIQETIQEVVASVDYTEIIKSDEAMAERFEELGVSEEVIEDLIGSQAVEEVIDLYVDDVFAAVEGNPGEASLTPEALAEIVDDNKEELLPIVEEFMMTQADTREEMSEQELEQLLDSLVEEHGEEIITMLPTAEEMGIVSSEISQTENSTEEAPLEENSPVQVISPVTQENNKVLSVLKNLHNGTFVTVLIVAAVVLSVLILLCRWMRFKGFMWLGVTYFIAFLLSLVVLLIVKDLDLLQQLALPEELQSITGFILPAVVSGLTKGTVILVSLSVVFVVVFIVGRVLGKKKEKEVNA